MSASEAELRAFVETSIGGRVLGFERATSGSSRVTLFVDAEDGSGTPLALVLRHDSGDGPLSGTDIDLAHEARVYRALAGRRVRIPRLLAEADDGRSLLLERATGSDALGAHETTELRTLVARDFYRALAELHALDPAELDLPGIAHPRTPADHARLDLERWLGISRTKLGDPSETVALAGDWLGANPPSHVDRSALCHGDAGMGNFLHADGRVTALLDWEFAHLGDPLDDIGWVRVRSHLLGSSAEMRTALPVWSEQSGLPLDSERIPYYTALVLLRMTISCQAALVHAKATSAMDTTVFELLLPYLNFLLPRALREAGCRDSALVRLEQRGEQEIASVPVLKAMARPLEAWTP